ncbi:SNF2-related protein [Sulfidibacter corallicola]
MDQSDARLYQTTAEEFAVTYATPDMVDAVICNPPFGKRIGTTSLDELVTDIHLPQLFCFESYFLFLASQIAKTWMMFILPDSFANQAENQFMLRRLANMGWNLQDLRRLPLDACDNSLVHMSLWLFKRVGPTETVFDWVDRAIATAQAHNGSPLYRQVTEETVTNRHGPLQGYLLPETPLISSSQAFKTTKVWAPDLTVPAIHWTPEPQPIGTLWERQGCMYALTDSGWAPANEGGYAEGLPVSKPFQRARRAHALFRAGLAYTAYTLLECLDLAALRKEYGTFGFGSFLAGLEKGPSVPDPIARDLANLRLVNIAADLLTGFEQPVHLARIGDALFDPDSLDVPQIASLAVRFGEDRLLPQNRKTLDEALQSHQIPLSQLKLRAAWIPRPMIETLFGLATGRDGFYYSPRRKAPMLTALYSGVVAYLNYGRGGKRIREGDPDIYELACREFASWANGWARPEAPHLRRQLHLHYLATKTESTNVLACLGSLQPSVPPHWYQKEDVPFMLSGGLLAWDVGLGKTFGAILAAVSHGSKAVIVVPLAVLSKWAKEVRIFFPELPFRVLGFRKSRRDSTKYVRSTADMEQQVRDSFFNPTIRIILTTYERWAALTLDPQERIRADKEEALDRYGSSDNETIKKQRAAFVQYAAERNYHFGGLFKFTDLPLKNLLLIVDEAHNYKSLYAMPTGGWGDSLVMAGGCGESKRARDLRMKADLIREAGGKVLGLTATPVTNSVAEAFNMLRLFYPDALAKRGIYSVQAFIDSFCTIEPICTVKLSGQAVIGNTITGFTNLNELKSIWQEAMIARTAKDAKLKLPEVEETVIRIEPKGDLALYIDDQKEQLAESLSQNPSDSDTKVPHLFTVMARLNAVAEYPGLCDVESNPKMTRMVDQLMQLYRETTGGQIVFSDMTEAQQAIKRKLVEGGIPEAELAIINSKTCKTLAQRQKIQDDFNSGHTRVVIGGVVASEGLDLQKNAVAIHFNTICWNAQAMHQRTGRAVRQGNPHPRVHLFYYLLDGTLVVYRFATCQNKSHWWEMLRKAQTDNIQESVFSEGISDEMIASLAPDPVVALLELKNLRREKELAKQMKDFRKLLLQMLEFMGPIHQGGGAPVLSQLEERIRTLEWIPERIVQEGLRRVWTYHHFGRAIVPPKVANKAERWTRTITNALKDYQHRLDLWGDSILGTVFGLTVEEGEVVFRCTVESLVPETFRDRIPECPETFILPQETKTSIRDRFLAQGRRMIVLGELGSTTSDIKPETVIDVSAHAEAEEHSDQRTAQPAVQPSEKSTSPHQVPAEVEEHATAAAIPKASDSDVKVSHLEPEPVSASAGSELAKMPTVEDPEPNTSEPLVVCAVSVKPEPQAVSQIKAEPSVTAPKAGSKPPPTTKTTRPKTRNPRVASKKTKTERISMAKKPAQPKRKTKVPQGQMLLPGMDAYLKGVEPKVAEVKPMPNQMELPLAKAS